MRTWTEMKVVHLFPNELKFFKGAVEFFRPLQWETVWAISCAKKDLLQFQSIAPSHTCLPFDGEFKLPSQTDALVVHSLHLSSAQFILEQRASLPVYIQTWGGDTMTLLDSAWLFGRLTRNYYYSKSKLKSFPTRVGYPVYELKRKWHYKAWHSTLREAMLRADYTSFLFGAEERELVAPELPNQSEFRITYVPSTLNLELSQGKPEHILLGNSATPANQHLEALTILSKSSFDFDTITLPLSYGVDGYAEWIKRKAERLFGDKVRCLMDFLPLREYQQTVDQCGTIIMNHTRQQAIGNIFWSLKCGKRTLLNHDGIGYQFLRGKGVLCEALGPETLDTSPPSALSVRQSANSVIDHQYFTTETQRKSFFDSLFAR